jgi:RNA polymerase sigma-70 factor, ECF subfamily
MIRRHIMAPRPALPQYPDTTSSRSLLRRARAGDEHALDSLFARMRRALRRWATGRLPMWARDVNDTTDLVQDVLLQTFRRLDVFEDRGRGALRAYLRQAVDNRIKDELRRVSRRPAAELTEVLAGLPSNEPSPFHLAADEEGERRYKAALQSLTMDEQRLVVGRLELNYTYEQLAVIADRPSAEAARLAARRAVIKLAEKLGSG